MAIGIDTTQMGNFTIFQQICTTRKTAFDKKRGSRLLVQQERKHTHSRKSKTQNTLNQEQRRLSLRRILWTENDTSKNLVPKYSNNNNKNKNRELSESVASWRVRFKTRPVAERDILQSSFQKLIISFGVPYCGKIQSCLCFLILHGGICTMSQLGKWKNRRKSKINSKFFHGTKRALRTYNQ